ncbi:MAG: AAA family ATPase [Sedimentisphaerales bacterium]|nr:AAA family ATPase [Sedimentisphaerales bacterium]
MFKSIKIKNLRCLRNIEIQDLSQVTLFVGENNSGKTTILEGLFFLAGATNPLLPLQANSMRGLSFLRNDLWNTYFHNMYEDISIDISGRDLHTSDEHSLSIKLKKEIAKDNEVVTRDTISLKTENGSSRPTYVTNGLILTYRHGGNEKEEHTSWIHLKDNQLHPEKLKEPPAKAYYHGPSEHVDWKAMFGSIQRKKLTQDVVSCLRKIDPTINDLRLNEIGLLEADIGLSNLIPFNLMGGGLNRLLSIALSLLEYKKGIVLIDEIENGLHHSVQEILWDAVFTWAHELDVQVFATTHSWECVSAFAKCSKKSLFPDLGKVFRIERDKDHFHAVAFDSEKLDRFVEKGWEIR